MLKKLIPLGIIGGACAVFLTMLFGLAGFRFAAGFVMLCWTPFFLLLDRLIDGPERYWYSFFLSMPLYASLVYYLGFLIPLKLSLIVVSGLLIGLAFIPWPKKK